jgi:hypothetical protein
LTSGDNDKNNSPYINPEENSPVTKFPNTFSPEKRYTSSHHPLFTIFSPTNSPHNYACVPKNIVSSPLYPFPSINTLSPPYYPLEKLNASKLSTIQPAFLSQCTSFSSIPENIPSFTKSDVLSSSAWLNQKTDYNFDDNTTNSCNSSSVRSSQSSLSSPSFTKLLLTPPVSEDEFLPNLFSSSLIHPIPKLLSSFPSSSYCSEFNSGVDFEKAQQFSHPFNLNVDSKNININSKIFFSKEDISYVQKKKKVLNSKSKAKQLKGKPEEKKIYSVKLSQQQIDVMNSQREQIIKMEMKDSQKQHQRELGSDENVLFSLSKKLPQISNPTPIPPSSSESLPLFLPNSVEILKSNPSTITSSLSVLEIHQKSNNNILSYPLHSVTSTKNPKVTFTSSNSAKSKEKISKKDSKKVCSEISEKCFHCGF